MKRNLLATLFSGCRPSAILTKPQSVVTLGDLVSALLHSSIEGQPA